MVNQVRDVYTASLDKEAEHWLIQLVLGAEASLPFQSTSSTLLSKQSSKALQSAPISLGKPQQSLPTLQWGNSSGCGAEMYGH